MAGAARKQQFGRRATRYGSISGRRARGAILLEVLVSMALLIFGLAVVGLQVNKGLDAAVAAELGTKAVMLAGTKMAELNSGVVEPENANDELKGDFGLVYPGFTWRFRFKPTDVRDFLMVTLEIGYSARQAKAQADSPDQEILIDDDSVRIVETAYRLMPIRADVNLERDFGFTKEDFEKAQASLEAGAGAGGTAGNIDGSGADGGGAAQGNSADMSAILAALGQLLGGSFDPRMLAALPAEQLSMAQPFLQGLLGRGGVNAKGPLDDLARQGGGRRGGRRGPGRNNGNQNPGDQGANDGGGPGGPNAGDAGQGDGQDNNNGGRRRGGRNNANDAGDGADGGNQGNDTGNRNGGRRGGGRNDNGNGTGRSGRNQDQQNQDGNNQGRTGGNGRRQGGVPR